MKKRINSIAGVAIIYRLANPADIFLELKDDGHPIAHARRGLCFVGGNWIGTAALKDKNTYDTMLREVGEELSLAERIQRSSHEYVLLGVADLQVSPPTPMNDVEVTATDLMALARIKRAIAVAAPFGDFVNVVPRAVLDASDPHNTREEVGGLASYWAAGLDEEHWHLLSDLQERFGNLSNECITVLTSLSKILARGQKSAFGHDRVLQRFFLGHGLREAEELPMVPGISSEYVGAPLMTYGEYLMEYEVARYPSVNA